MTRETGILFRSDMVRAIAAGRKCQTRRPVNQDTLRVRLLDTVTSDEPVLGVGAPSIVAKPGVYRARLNQQGAVTILTKPVTGRFDLGVKPGEFHFSCPYADGVTVLANRGNGKKCWSIEPRDSLLWVRESYWIGHDSEVINDGQTVVDWGVDLRADKDAPLQYVATPENPVEPDMPGEWHGPNEWFPERAWVPWGQGSLGPRFFSKRPGIHMPRWASRFTLRVASVRIERLQDITDEDAIAEGARRFDDIPDPHPYKQGNRWSMDAEPPPNTEHCLGSPRSAFANYYERIHGEGAWDDDHFVWVISFERIAQEKAA